MLKIVYILFFSITAFTCFAQGQFIYTKQSNSNNMFSSICQEIQSSNLLISNITNTFIPSTNQVRYQSSVIKINPNGNVLNTYLLDSNFTSGTIVPGNQCYYIFGRQIINQGSNTTIILPTVIKYDLSFQVIKRLVLDVVYNNPPLTTNLIIKRNSLYMGYATSPPPGNTIIYKTDLNLNKMDSSNSFTGRGYNLENLNNEIKISGGAFLNSSTFGNNQIATIDTNFNFTNRYNLDSVAHYNVSCTSGWSGISTSASTIVSLSDTKYLIAGNALMYNSNCQLKYSNIFVIKNRFDQSENNKIISVDSLNNYFINSHSRHNSIYSVSMAGYDSQNPWPPQANNTKVIVSKLDTSGNILWVKDFGGDKYYLPLAIYATEDSGAVICGMRYDHEIPQVENICEGFVMKIRKDGSPDYLGIGKKEKLNMNYHKCFPNPAKEVLFFDIPLYSNMEISIIDELGREIINCKNYQNLSAFNIATLKPGTYVYNILSNNNTYSGKFVKE